MRTTVIRLFVLVVIAMVSGCASSGDGSNSFLKTHDYNGDGKISRDEYHRSFDSLDSDGDAHLDDGEIGSVLAGH